jgi:TetR/AcrR family transcriptional repressor of lmrAB and yxaGH operons
MVQGAATLIGTRGVSATSLSDILEESQAPRGSIYHHFPGGKAEIVGEAMRWTTEQVLAYQRTCTATTPPEVLGYFVDLFRQSVVSSGCRAGCPVAGVVVDTSTEERLLREGRASFRSWVALLTDQLVSAGSAPEDARSLAIMTLASIEGALILCRAEGSVAPLEAVASQLGQLAASGPTNLGKGANRAPGTRRGGVRPELGDLPPPGKPRRSSSGETRSLRRGARRPRRNPT